MARTKQNIVVPPVTGSEVGRRVVRKWSEVMPTKLTESELWDLARHAAELVVEYASVEEEKKHAGKEFTKQLREIRKETESLARNVTTGAADRDVDIQEILDFAEDVVYRVRMDTGEVIVRRKPTDAERQESFQFGEAS